jgi:hypothetical protein
MTEHAFCLAGPGSKRTYLGYVSLFRLRNAAKYYKQLFASEYLCLIFSDHEGEKYPPQPFTHFVSSLANIFLILVMLYSALLANCWIGKVKESTAMKSLLIIQHTYMVPDLRGDWTVPESLFWPPTREKLPGGVLRSWGHPQVHSTSIGTREKFNGIVLQRKEFCVFSGLPGRAIYTP